MNDVVTMLFGLLIVGFLVYLCIPGKSAKTQVSGEGQSSRSERKDRARQVSGMTGFLGGSVEDAFIAQHALNRGHGDSTKADARDVAASVAMQQQNRFSD